MQRKQKILSSSLAIIITNISSASAIGVKDKEVSLWNNSFKNIRIINFLKNNVDSHFYMKICGTVYDVTTHYDPKWRQCVLKQFKELLLQREWR